MGKATQKRRVGELRPSQLIFTFGIGSIVELPHLSVMVLGLDDWNEATVSRLEEPRLLGSVQRLRQRLGGQIEYLAAPPVSEESYGKDPLGAPKVGVPVTPFPHWVYCPFCNLLGPLSMGVFKLKANAFRPDRAQYVHENCPKTKRPPAVLPARFLVSCANGHLHDFPWKEFVHQGAPCSGGALRLFEFGTSGQASEVVVKCEGCDTGRNMATAFARENRDQFLGACQGRRPHLRDYSESCNAPLETVLAGASNVWFPLKLSVLSIPQHEDPLRALVQQHHSELENLPETKEAALTALTWFCKPIPEFSGYTPEQVYNAFLSSDNKAEDTPPKEADLKGPEWQLFSCPDEVPKSADLELEEVSVPSGYSKWIERVVLAKRLREVHAFVGFTRLESEGDFGGLDELPEDRWVPISRKPPKFVPATEVRGEGVFLQLREALVEEWTKRPEVMARSQELFAADEAWRRIRRIPNPEGHFPGMRYVLLHTFAHALMRQLSLGCGYSSASIRERLYSADAGEDGNTTMAGLLIYTASPDSEGTLGGLVETGKPEHLAGHIQQALESMGLCSSDPLCSEQLPLTSGLTLHGAACHACLFSPETSCERGNKYLDRNILVPTISHDKLAFFQPSEVIQTEEPAPSREADLPAVLPQVGPITILSYEKSRQGEEVGRARFQDFGLEDTDPEDYFALAAPNGLEEMIEPGTLCLFKKLTEIDPLPPDDTLVLARHPLLADPHWGQVTFRRFFATTFKDADQKESGTDVLLRSRPKDRTKYPNQTLKFSPKEWAAWRPLAVWKAQAKKPELRSEM